MEPQQSFLYSQYIQRLGWEVKTIDRTFIYIKHLPIIGGLAKLQRPTTLPSTKKMLAFIKENRIRTLAVEPDSSISEQIFSIWSKDLASHVKLNKSYFLPTKTSLVDISSTEDVVFRSFSEAKRRAVRRAMKHGIAVEESGNIDELIRIKNKSSGLFGFVTTTGIKHLWTLFAPKHATILLAYTRRRKLVGGVLLLFWDKIAYYWIAGATREGKQQFAPTLLIWESLRRSKKAGATAFDFVGVWDERIPSKNREWLGFTKFKEGFGGVSRYYPLIP